MSGWRWADILLMRTRSLLFRRRVEEELQKELRFHLERGMEEAREAGLTSEEARRRAQRRLGGIAQIQEECRDMRRTNTLETLGQDLGYATRLFAKSPGFTVVMILTLALSIGATSAIASIIEGVLLRPLPFRDSGRLVRVFLSSRFFTKFPINPNDFRDFRARVHSFESFAAYNHRDVQLAEKNEAVRLSCFSVTAGFFHVLGLSPAMGREFDQADELPGHDPVAIVSDKIWRTALGARRDALGQKITLDAVRYRVVGVMPPGIRHPGNMYHAMAYGKPVDAWIPFTFDSPNDRGSHYLDGIARLRKGVTIAQARSEINAAMQQLGREHPDGDSGWNVLVVPLQEEIVGRSERTLFVLMGAVALVLLLACVNAANLLLAKATARQREMAVRAALGAGRRRLIRQTLTESLLLAMAGAALALSLALGGIKALLAFLPADFPRAGDIRVDAAIFLFTLLIAAGTGIGFGLVPALQASGIDLRAPLHESGRSTTGSRQTLQLRNGLVVTEVALSCVLLIGAGLMLRSLINLVRVDPGFRPGQVLTASISLPRATYKDASSVAHFSERLLQQMRGITEMNEVGIGSDLPWTGWDDNAGGFHIQGETPPPHDDFGGRYHMATPGYFQALGIPIVRGRYFDEHDTANSRKVLIINRAMAKYWQHGDALGGRMTFSDHPKEEDWMTIVGIVGDVKDAPQDARARPAFWWPMQQVAFQFRDFSIAIRSQMAPKEAADRLRSALRDLDPGLAVADVHTMENIADNSYAASRFAFVLVGSFAALALVLAAIGTYGVIAYTVNQRIHEFGVRMALGARPRDLVRSVLASGLKLTVAGIAAGVTFGLVLSRLLGGLLYGVGVTDPLTIGATTATTLIVAALACFVPAVRATRANPMIALRAD